MPIPKDLLKRLYYNSHLSVSQIASKLDLSVHKVIYWMDIYQLKRRSRSEANYQKYNPDGDPFSIKNKFSIQDVELLNLCLGLFWGEGNKVNRHGVRLTNSDPALINTWCLFLRKVCNVNEAKIRFYLQTFKDNNIITAKEYWSNTLNIHPSRINTGKPTHTLGKGSYTKISQYGVMTVGVFNTHFHTWMMEQLQKFGYNPPVN